MGLQLDLHWTATGPSLDCNWTYTGLRTLETGVRWSPPESTGHPAEVHQTFHDFL